MADDSYDLTELCDAAGVTPRTVRYYVQQGLLPAPGARGPGARYDAGHRDRLRLIKRLQREHLPLAEIRARLATLGDEAVAALLHEPASPPPAGSALEYVRQVLAGRPAQSAPQSAPPAGPQRSHVARMTRPIAGPPAGASPPLASPMAFRDEASLAAHALPAALHDAVQDAMADEPSSPGPARSTWERIVLGPDVELHVRRPLSRPQNKLVERLVVAARRLLADPP